MRPKSPSSVRRLLLLVAGAILVTGGLLGLIDGRSPALGPGDGTAPDRAPVEAATAPVPQPTRDAASAADGPSTAGAAREVVAATPDPDASEPDAWDGASIEGWVTLDGAPPPRGVRLRLVGDRLRYTIDVDERGRFRDDDLPVGPGVLRVVRRGVHEGFPSSGYDLVYGSQAVDLEAGTTHTVHLSLGSGTITGNVLGLDGRPEAGATVLIQGAAIRGDGNARDGYVAARTLRDGTFTSRPLPCGSYRVAAYTRRALAAFRDVVVASSGDRGRVTLALQPPVRATGTLVAPAGLGDARWRLRFTGPSSPEVGVRRDGTFRLARVLPGRYAVELVSPADHEVVTESVYVGGGGATGLVIEVRARRDEGSAVDDEEISVR